ncbi:hypothetical protein Tco_1318659 [Tanacetum coccineum]
MRPNLKVLQQVMPSSEQSNVAAVQNSNSSTQQDALILSVIEQLKTQVANCTKINLDNKSVNDTLTSELERYKEQKAQHLEPKLYDGNVIKNTSAIVIPDSKKTLMLAEESHSKMILKQKDPMMLEKRVNTTPNFVNSPDPTLSSRPTKVEVPKELPKVSIINTSLKKLKYHLAGFDVVVKERITATAITEGSYAKLIQELLIHISKTCPNERTMERRTGTLVDCDPQEARTKRVRFTGPSQSSEEATDSIKISASNLRTERAKLLKQT